MKGITKEALDWLEHNQYCDSIGMEHVRILAIISPPPNLAAKWQDRTRGGYEFEIFAERKGDLYGLCHFNGGFVQTAWTRKGTSIIKKEFDLIPRSKHSELIAEAQMYCCKDSTSVGMQIIRKLITALEQEGQ